MRGFSIRRQETSASPSGCHVGHYKALSRSETPIEDHENTWHRFTKNPQGYEFFIELYHISLATVQIGETIDQRKIVKSAMIEKEPWK